AYVSQPPDRLPPRQYGRHTLSTQLCSRHGDKERNRDSSQSVPVHSCPHAPELSSHSHTGAQEDGGGLLFLPRRELPPYPLNCLVACSCLRERLAEAAC